MADLPYFVKDPDAVLDYVFDWAASTNSSGDTDWLASGETISSHSISADTGLTVDSSALSDSNTSVTVWLSGGTAGTMYGVRCRVTTSASRTDDRTIQVRVLER